MGSEAYKCLTTPDVKVMATGKQHKGCVFLPSQ